MTTVKVTTANICGNPIRLRSAVRKRMTQALTLPGVTFGQECDQSNHFRVGRGNYSHAWHAIASSKDKVTEGGGREVPISLPSEYTVVSCESVLMHKGKKLVSPNRFATVVRTELEGRKVAFINCHTVSKPRLGVPFGKWRLKQFNLYIAKLRTIISGLKLEGYSVFFGGDMNHAAPLLVHPEQQVLIQSGLDHLWLVPSNSIIWSNLQKHKVARTALMDHPILSVSLVLSDR